MAGGERHYEVCQLTWDGRVSASSAHPEIDGMHLDDLGHIGWRIVHIVQRPDGVMAILEYVRRAV